MLDFPLWMVFLFSNYTFTKENKTPPVGSLLANKICRYTKKNLFENSGDRTSLQIGMSCGSPVNL